MTLVPLTECCLWLGIDRKTLHLWLKAVNFSCCLHPTDARLKCLTLSQLQHLAQLHGRRLPTSVPDTETEPTAPPQITGQGNGADDAELRHQLVLLQAQVATLQAQVTELALHLLRGGFSPIQHPARSPETPPPASPVSCTPASVRSTARPAQRFKAPVRHAAPPEPERPHARSRALPLIEACDDGSYVVIAPDSGVVSLAPDSPEWFAWLASLSGFSFQGKLGRFRAARKFRKGQRVQSWNIHRSLHGRSCTLYLGLTPTLARLEAMAATAHARLTHS